MKLSYEQLENAATNGGNLVENMANGAKDAVCGAYHNYKDWYNQNVRIDTFQNAVLQSFWNNVCPLEPPYVPPELPPETDFEGGQCGCQVYIVEVTVSDGAVFGNNCYGPIRGCRILFTDRGNNKVDANIQVLCRGTYDNGFSPCKQEIGWTTLSYQPYVDKYTSWKITRVADKFGGPDTCGNPPSPELPPPIAPPNQIDDIVPIGEGDGLINVPIKINPQIQLPSLNVNVFAPIFKPEFNANLNPQFNIKPNININPTINFNFGMDGVDVDFGLPGGTPPNSLPPDIVNNIENITNNTNTTKDDVKEIKDKLACDPCEKLEEIKKKLDYAPVYRSNSTGEFQSTTRDNLFNLGYIEIELTQLPTSTKIVFGGNAPNAMYAGWIFFRMNGVNFEKQQITSANSVFWVPKNCNGFAITCTHGAKANCYYYIENKD